MKRKSILVGFACILTLVLSLTLPITVLAIPEQPHQFYGTVTIASISAEDGLLVEAKINGVTYGTCSTYDGNYGRNYDGVTNLMKVAADDPDTTTIIEGGVNGDTIKFYVDGAKANEEATFEVKGFTEWNLTVDVALVTYILTVTCEPAESGDVALDPTQPAEGYAAGTSVELTATAAGGYAFGSWSGDLSGSTNPDTITMDSAKTVTANFAEIGALAVSTDPATGIGTTTATLNGNLTDLGDASSGNVSFEWGTSISYGNETSTQSMTSTGSFTASLTGLSPSTTYYFKAKAKTVSEETYGQGLRFTTRAISTGGDSGGGGGGGDPTYYPETNLFGIEGRFTISYEGKIQKKIEATSENGMLTITIPKGTIALGEDGKRLKGLTAVLDESPPDPPEDAHVIGLAYNFGPAGTTFDPPITLTWSYDPDALPEGVAEEDLVLAYYDEEAGEWVELDCVVDTENNTITASVSHFTTIAIIVSIPPPPPAPAAFSVTNLSVKPLEVQPKEAVTITVLVANTGGTEGSYSVVLKLNGVKEAEKRVTVAAGRSQSVSFSVSKEDAGTYSLVVDGLSASFTVVALAPVVAPAPPPRAPPPAPAPAPPAPAPPAPAPPEVIPPTAPNWPLIGGIIAATVIVGLLIFFLIRRRAK